MTVTALRCPVAPPPLRHPCPHPPAGPLGLCVGHLAAASEEYARLLSDPAPDNGSRPSDTPYRDLCVRCGRPGHDARRCDA
jgi:hypothetical protein